SHRPGRKEAEGRYRSHARPQRCCWIGVCWIGKPAPLSAVVWSRSSRTAKRARLPPAFLNKAAPSKRVALRRPVVLLVHCRSEDAPQVTSVKRVSVTNIG